MLWLRNSGIAVAALPLSSIVLRELRAIVGSMSLAQSFRAKYGATALHVANEKPEQRVKKSAEQTDGLIRFLKIARITKKDREQCVAVVVSDEHLMAADRCRLLDALSEVRASRRICQKWVHTILNIFTQKDWDTWRTQGQPFRHDILKYMLVRVRNVAGQHVGDM